jgi:hypothetical protein
MRSSYMPSKKADQVQWAQTIDNVVGPSYGAYGIAKELMDQFAASNTTLQAAWNISKEPATRTRGSIAATDNSLRAMKVAARGLVSIVQGTPGVTDQMKIDAGLTVRKTPSKKPAPSESPIVTVTNVSGRTVTLKLRQDGERRAKPVNVQNALVFTYTGQAAPQDTNLWTFVMTTTDTTVQIPFPPSETGDTVWITAMWVNAKSETGPAATPVSVNLPAGGVLPAEAGERTVRRAA